jgi:hypothetical protein
MCVDLPPGRRAGVEHVLARGELQQRRSELRAKILDRERACRVARKLLDARGGSTRIPASPCGVAGDRRRFPGGDERFTRRQRDD